MISCHLTSGDELASSKIQMSRLTQPYVMLLAFILKAGNGTPFNYSWEKIRSLDDLLKLISAYLQPLLMKKNGCDPIGNAVSPVVAQTFNHSLWRRMVVTFGIWLDRIYCDAFQPLLMKKNGCDQATIITVEIMLFFQPLLMKKNGCDSDCRSIRPQKDLRLVDREPGQPYFLQ